MKEKTDMLKLAEKATLSLRGLYESWGYKKYRMGRFEEYSLYAANNRFLSSEKVLTFTDLDGRLMALKPDVTLSILKNTKATEKSREKLYYIESVFRESKESHTYREISQMGLEVLGNVDLYAIAEVLRMAAKSMSILGKHYILEISNMDFVMGLLDAASVSEEESREILPLIRGKNAVELKRKLQSFSVEESFIQDICRLTSLYGRFSDTLKKAEAMVKNKKMAQAVRMLSELYAVLKSAGTVRNLQLDFSMVNDMEYYNGIVFQGYLEELPRHVLAGGQYDGMVKRMGKEGAGIGFAVYLSELERMPVKTAEYDVEALILYNDTADLSQLFQAAQSFVQKGMRVRVEETIPEELRYEKIYRFENGVLQEGKKEC